MIAHHDFAKPVSVLLLRFVSISKNYRSVIRACMEELQQVAGQNGKKIFFVYLSQRNNQINFLIFPAVSTKDAEVSTQYGNQVCTTNFSCATNL